MPKRVIKEENKIFTYDEMIKHLNDTKRQKHLLLGNGFSMAYDPGIFSYNALSTFIDKLDNQLVRNLFSIIKTNNFELLMKQLDDFAAMADVFGIDKATVKKIRDTSSELKINLIEAVKELHPEHVFAIEEAKSKACADFLSSFLNNGGNIFTANYDLLLYWVLMRNKVENHCDGFGRDAEDAEEYSKAEDITWSELRWGKHRKEQNVHYLHGALPLFDSGADIIKEEYNGKYILKNIKQRLDKKEYPVFITAGNGKEKLTNINHNRYLAFCYEALCSITGSLITFGFNFGQYDTHIIDAINKAARYSKEKEGKLYSIYIGVYSEADIAHIKSIEGKFKCKVNLFDTKTVNIWNQ